jgi:hypothetical protein
MILMSVDLPAPFSPRIAWIMPRRQEKSDQQFVPSLSCAKSAAGIGSEMSCGIGLPWSAVIAALIEMATSPDDWPIEIPFRPSLACWAISLRKPFSASPAIGTNGW